MRYTGPKNKIARRESIDLGLKTVGSKSHASLLKKINIVPGQHGTSRKGKPTDYGIQLREKQKVKRMYGVVERQMKNYFLKASKMKGNTAENLITLLERRLDNVVYKLGFAPTKYSARQLVNHGHFTVNGKKITIPSFQLSINDVITFRKEESQKIPYIAELLAKKDLIIPAWLDKKAAVGKLISFPKAEETRDDINLQLVVEFYSR